MTDSGMFAAFLTLALVVPAALLIVVRFLAWALPPPYNWLAGVMSRHPVAFSLLDAGVWLALVGASFKWDPAHWTIWAWRAAALLFAADAIWRAARRSKGKNDFLTTGVTSN